LRCHRSMEKTGYHLHQTWSSCERVDTFSTEFLLDDQRFFNKLGASCLFFNCSTCRTCSPDRFVMIGNACIKKIWRRLKYAASRNCEYAGWIPLSSCWKRHKFDIGEIWHQPLRNSISAASGLAPIFQIMAPSPMPKPIPPPKILSFLKLRSLFRLFFILCRRLKLRLH